MARRELVTAADIMKSVQHVGEDLPKLTESQMGFVHSIMAGKSASQAYRENYNCADSSPNTISGNACRTFHHPKIKKWLSAAAQAQLGNAVLTRDNHLRQMERLRELAVDTGDLKSAVKAEEVRGYVAGLRVERVEITHNDPAAILQQIRAINPKIAEQLANQYGMNVAPIIEHEPTEEPV